MSQGVGVRMQKDKDSAKKPVQTKLKLRSGNFGSEKLAEAHRIK